MALINTPARMGRALEFGKYAPLPVWTKGGTEYAFPNSLGWFQIFQIGVIEIPQIHGYGEPFLDYSVMLPLTIDSYDMMEREFSVRLPSIRIQLNASE